MGFSFVFGGRDQTKPLIAIAQSQTELIRVATLGSAKATTLDARALAATTQLSLTSAQQETLSYLKKHHRKPSTKELAATKDASTDEALNKAALNNNFDASFAATMHDKLTIYQQALQKTYDGVKSASEKQLLKQLYTQTVTLLGQK